MPYLPVIECNYSDRSILVNCIQIVITFHSYWIISSDLPRRNMFHFSFSDTKSLWCCAKWFITGYEFFRFCLFCLVNIWAWSNSLKQENIALLSNALTGLYYHQIRVCSLLTWCFGANRGAVLAPNVYPLSLVSFLFTCHIKFETWNIYTGKLSTLSLQYLALINCLINEFHAYFFIIITSRTPVWGSSHRAQIIAKSCRGDFCWKDFTIECCSERNIWFFLHCK